MTCVGHIFFMVLNVDDFRRFSAKKPLSEGVRPTKAVFFRFVAVFRFLSFFVDFRRLSFLLSFLLLSFFFFKYYIQCIKYYNKILLHILVFKYFVKILFHLKILHTKYYIKNITYKIAQIYKILYINSTNL